MDLKQIVDKELKIGEVYFDRIDFANGDCVSFWEHMLDMRLDKALEQAKEQDIDHWKGRLIGYMQILCGKQEVPAQFAVRYDITFPISNPYDFTVDTSINPKRFSRHVGDTLDDVYGKFHPISRNKDAVIEMLYPEALVKSLSGVERLRPAVLQRLSDTFHYLKEKRKDVSGVCGVTAYIGPEVRSTDDS
ncbi:MAG: hypothetical protein ABIA62_07545 [Candidatus Woesearchaeota archaeon]